MFSAVLEDTEKMKQDIVDCNKKEEEKQLELSELVALRAQKCSELEELKVDNWRYL